jgi:anti-sigma B factor antagonist
MTFFSWEAIALVFISSAGLRVFAKARKTMTSRKGKVYFTHLTPQVKKVFDIVKAVLLAEVFANIQELDAYLEAMQAGVNKESN